jgi:hypothetical protein
MIDIELVSNYQIQKMKKDNIKNINKYLKIRNHKNVDKKNS